LLDLGNRYAKESSWKDFALVKFCLFSMGLLAGMHMPEKQKKTAAKAAIFAFSATYIPLMAKVFKIAAKKGETR
ncbi:MAG: permease of phosphate ABC transporter, partial [Firmicutes bacterium]|nr:permease of phosphate ABC transporter [Bacillota bacterium]